MLSRFSIEKTKKICYTIGITARKDFFIMRNKANRIFCWDKKIIEKEENLLLLAHKPEKKNIALLCDDEWEGVHNGYGCTVRVGDTIRLYYRAATERLILTEHAPNNGGGTNVICVAESKDGITYKKPNIGKYEYNGSTYNNIVFMREEEMDNFSVFYDKNPSCPENEKFKALVYTETPEKDQKLRYFSSADGYNFKEEYDLPLYGAFDSFNLGFWDEETEQYFVYYRTYHEKGVPEIAQDRQLKNGDIRDIRLATSKDFKSFTTHGCLKFEEGQEDVPLYTNQIEKYYRAKSTFIGFPVRYTDRKDEYESYEDMPLADQRKATVEKYGRTGTAITDCLFMTSNDGYTFNRRDEAFMTPGPEERNNWRYGNCYTAHGIVETKAEEEGASNEISIYASENYRMKNANFRRYTIRLDGFYSWFGSYKGAEILTKPITVTGERLSVNFASSCAGGMKISLCDASGSPIEGFTSNTIFGDSTDRTVRFTGNLKTLIGKDVRLKIVLKDCHLYSFAFI